MELKVGVATFAIYCNLPAPEGCGARNVITTYAMSAIRKNVPCIQRPR
jgi:hypothetical protein